MVLRQIIWCQISDNSIDGLVFYLYLCSAKHYWKSNENECKVCAAMAADGLGAGG